MRKLDPAVWERFFGWIQEEAARRGFPNVDSIADAAGIDSSTLWRWRESTNGPTLGKLAEVADALGLSIAQLGEAFDRARGTGLPEAPHRPWPTFDEIVQHASDLSGAETDMLRRTLAAVRAAKGGQTTTVIVT